MKIRHIIFLALVSSCAISHGAKTVSVEPKNHYVEKKMVVMIPSYNNIRYFKRNLDSVLYQNYTNYRIIYTDDCSPDGTGKAVAGYLASLPEAVRSKVTLLQNTERHKALANHYKMVHMCDNDAVVVLLDGDDHFKDNSVLSKLNMIYQNGNVWMTYGRFLNWPMNKPSIGYPVKKEVIDRNGFREMSWIFGHIRSYYAWLFKRIPVADLISPHGSDEGLFYATNSDLATFYPMLEMAGNKVRYIHEIMYMRNVETPLNDFKKNHTVQMQQAHDIRKRRKYHKLTAAAPHYFEAFKKELAHILIISSDEQRTQTLIKTLGTKVTGFENIFVVGEHVKPHYDTQNKTIYYNPKSLTRLPFSKTSHILMLDDHAHIVKPIDLSQCIYDLEVTGAYGYHLAREISHTDNGCLRHVPLGGTLWAWQYKYGRDMWASQERFHATLYRAIDCKEILLAHLRKQKSTPDAQLRFKIGIFNEHASISLEKSL